MQANENTVDRALRFILGIAAIVAAFVWLGIMEGAIVGIVVALVGLVLTCTGLCGFCPGYRLIGVSTCKVDPGASN